MRKFSTAIAILSAAFLLIPSLAYAEPVASSKAALTAPPARPAPLTPAQFQALQDVQAQPEHAQLLDTTATYSDTERQKALEWTRFSDDVWTAIYQVCWPGAYLGILICAL
ncbi:MAG TPA: hypothetical protein PL151_14420 [Phycisphaerae bacterium]|nr:hypothetical protein [Phycisphaerae bacterium]HOJ76358.1 hypothetical protein [Phycisphaerae bacterium]HOM53699.1 hypothetical protein [Phycisphaerae bacterium]HON68568.1 hypothetical protein [Phycisphaerae bacterium]HOQ88205.1 hypothetical protein [Phycisphaerae bacterium]